MAMVKCVDCNKEMSDEAKVCPNCGKQVRPIGLLLGMGIFILSPIFAWFTLRKGYTTMAKVIAFIWMLTGGMALTGILFSLILPNILGKSTNSKEEIACIQMKSINGALKNYKLQKGVYPSNKDEMLILTENFLNGEIPTDPWGNQFLMKSDGDVIEIFSYGADGKEGGLEKSADIILSKCK